jgi:hypothetical protein
MSRKGLASLNRRKGGREKECVEGDEGLCTDDKDQMQGWVTSARFEEESRQEKSGL